MRSVVESQSTLKKKKICDCDVAASLLCDPVSLSTAPFSLVVCAAIVQTLRVTAINICITAGAAAQCLFMKAAYAALTSMYAHRYRPICQPWRANYLIRRDIVLEPRVSLCNIKTYVAEAAEMVSMSMNALENFGRGCCIRTPQGYQHAAPLLVCHSSSSARAEKEPVGSDAFSQLGRLMKVIWFHT